MDTGAGRNQADIPTNPAVVGVFLDFTLDTRQQLLRRGPDAIRLRPRTYDVLAHLVRHAGRLVPKQELIDAVWKDVAVTDDSLVQCLIEIRRALGDREDVVETVRGRGYLLNATVHWHGDPPPAASLPPVEPAVPRSPRTRAWAGVATAAATVTLLGLGVIVWRGTKPDASAATPPVIRSLAVLPLENLSGDPEQEYFADGITDDLITELSKIGALRVISRTSVMRFKQTRQPLAAIARALDVDAVVVGTVSRSAERVRVTAQVVQSEPERNLWAERYDRPRGDVVVLQGTLAREIAEAIRARLTPQEKVRFARPRTVDQEAYEDLLRGRYVWARRTEDSTRKAIDYFERAIARDPSYAPAYVGLADSYLSLSEGLQEGLPPNDAFPRARDLAMRALQLDDTLGEAHASLAHIRFQYDRDWAGAEREFTRAIDLNPNDANAHHWYALCLSWMHRPQEALAEVERAQRLDPLVLAIQANRGFILAASGDYARAIDQGRKAIDVDPGFAQSHYRLGQAYMFSGRYAEAIPELRQAIALSGDSPRATGELGLVYALAGRDADARQLIVELRARSKTRYVSPFDLALVYGGLGDREATFAWLDRAVVDRSPALNLLRLSPAFASIRSDPRFATLVKRAGLPP